MNLTEFLICTAAIVSASVYMLSALFDTPLLAYVTGWFTKRSLYTREDWEDFARENWPTFFRKLLSCPICCTPYLVGLFTIICSFLFNLEVSHTVVIFMLCLAPVLFLVRKYRDEQPNELGDMLASLPVLDTALKEHTEDETTVIRKLGVEMEKIGGKLIVRRIDSDRADVLYFFRDDYEPSSEILATLKERYLQELAQQETENGCSDCDKAAIKDKYYETVRRIIRATNE